MIDKAPKIIWPEDTRKLIAKLTVIGSSTITLGDAISTVATIMVLNVEKQPETSSDKLG